MNEKESVDLSKVESDQHFTQPPPRYTDASLIKKMEELGIGRPSTYASILQVLINRNYVEKEKGKHGHDPLFKVRYLVVLFLNGMQVAWISGQNATIDESMIKYMGRAVSYIQYMPVSVVRRPQSNLDSWVILGCLVGHLGRQSCETIGSAN